MKNRIRTHPDQLQAAIDDGQRVGIQPDETIPELAQRLRLMALDGDGAAQKELDRITSHSIYGPVLRANAKTAPTLTRVVT